MNEQLYNAAWDAVEPITEEYLSLAGRFALPFPRNQADYNRVHAEYITIRDKAVIPFGITFAELEEENGRRVDALLARERNQNG